MSESSRKSGQTPGREPRSRHDRPCDICRRHKHLCMIPVRGEPCVSCATRKKDCTFDMPPTVRKRKPKVPPEEASPAGPSRTPDTKPQAMFSPYTAPAAPPRTADAGPKLALPLSYATTSNARMYGGRDLLPSSLEYHPEYDDKDENPPSLDPREGEEEESHFVGTRAFFGLMLKEGAAQNATEPPNRSFQRLATLAFRQVSADPRLPAYFIKQPSLLYGRGPSSAKAALEAVWNMCASLGEDLPARAIERTKEITIPAFPLFSSRRLDIACSRPINKGAAAPVALMAGIVAHSTPYLPEIGGLHKNLWAQTLLALEDEYRQPRLRTIQLALLILSSRPSENVGQSEIGLARAVGAAHLLGLHIDPTRWNLPRWERSVRKCMWWILLIHDKWRALIHGRPCNLHDSDYNVCLPDLSDRDSDTEATPGETLSFESFIATCKLTLIVDKLLKQFYTVQAFMHPATGLTRVAGLEAVRTELDDFEQSLPLSLRLHLSPETATTVLPTGVRSFQLSLCGVHVIANRLIVESVTDRLGPHTAMALNDALIACEKITDLVVRLTLADRGLFWMPYSSHHLSNAVSLLLRIALSDRHGELHILDAAVGCTIRLIDSLVEIHLEQSTWDVATAALRRIATLLLIATRELPQLSNTYTSVAKALNLPTSNVESATTAEQLLESLGLALGPADWLEADFSWLNQDLVPGMPLMSDIEGPLF